MPSYCEWNVSTCADWINLLGVMLIYICTRMPTAHHDVHIYMRALLTNAYRTYSLVPRPRPDFILQPWRKIGIIFHCCDIKSGRGLGMRLPCLVAKPNKTGVNPCLLGSNKSRPHLSTYITTQKKQEGAVLVREWLWIFTRAAKHEAFSWTQRASGL